MIGNRIPRAPSGFSLYCTHNNPTPGNGLATIIRNDIPHLKININTNLQATAYRIGLDKQYTVCNIYVSPNAIIQLHEISNLIEQLPPPVII